MLAGTFVNEAELAFNREYASFPLIAPDALTTLLNDIDEAVFVASDSLPRAGVCFASLQRSQVAKLLGIVSDLWLKVKTTQFAEIS